MRRAEEHFHTPEQVSEHLAQALALVEAHDPPDDLRVPFFVKAADLLAAKQVFFEQPQPVQVDPRLLNNHRRR